MLNKTSKLASTVSPAPPSIASKLFGTNTFSSVGLITSVVLSSSVNLASSTALANLLILTYSFLVFSSNIVTPLYSSHTS